MTHEMGLLTQRPGIYASSKAAMTRISETLKVELEPLGVRVVTVMSGSADTPLFDKPGGQLRLPEGSYYHGVEEAAAKERRDHQRQATKVDVLANRLVKDILGGTRGMIWYGAFAPTVRYITWAFPAWIVDRLVNAERGIRQVKRL